MTWNETLHITLTLSLFIRSGLPSSLLPGEPFGNQIITGLRMRKRHFYLLVCHSRFTICCLRRGQPRCRHTIPSTHHIQHSGRNTVWAHWTWFFPWAMVAIADGGRCLVRGVYRACWKVSSVVYPLDLWPCINSYTTSYYSTMSVGTTSRTTIQPFAK